MDKLRQLHNLTLNCNSEAELNEYKKVLGINVESKLAEDCTVLGMYYLQPSKNDPSHSLKNVGTRQFYRTRE